MVPQPLSAARHDNVHGSSKACLVHFWFPHANANRHNHTQTNARRKGHLWIHYYESGYSNRKAADDSHGRRRRVGGDGAMQLMIYSSCSFIHLPSSFSPTGTHQRVNALQRLSSEKFILRCRGNCTDTVGLVCLPPVLLLHTCACTSILLSLHPPSILSPLTTPSGCLCQCSSRNCLVKRGWRNL